MIAVVVPVFNKAETLRSTVPAVLSQTGVDAWVWVDDGSTDGSLQVLNKLTASESRASVVALGSNRGRATARNSGVSATDADTVVFLDADVVPRADAASRLAEAATRSGAVAAVAEIESTGIDTKDPYHVYLRRHPRGPGAAAAGRPLAWKYFVTAACAVRAKALRDAGMFDESIQYGEDLALAQALQVKHPHGLVAAETTVDLLDVGGLQEALANVEAFGLGLAAIAQRSPSVYATMGLDVLGNPGSFRYRFGASAVVASAIRSAIPLLPKPGVAYAVRYLLAHHLLLAHARARASK